MSDESHSAWERHQRYMQDWKQYYGSNYNKQQSQSVSKKQNNTKTELELLRDNHRFLRPADEEAHQDLTWEQRIAKKYYDLLFKEYALVELKHYKDGKIAMRWRIQQEVVSGKGQFTCGALRCDETKGLQSWEVNFAYFEDNEKKNALVKLRLCPRCSSRLNYKTVQKRAKDVVNDESEQSKISAEEEEEEDQRADKESSSKRRRSNHEHHQRSPGTKVDDRHHDPKRPRRKSEEDDGQDISDTRRESRKHQSRRTEEDRAKERRAKEGEKEKKKQPRTEPTRADFAGLLQ